MTLSYPHSIPIMRNCSVEATRRQVEYHFNRRALTENLPVLQELAKLRAELAGVLGYDNHAAYVLETRMAKTPGEVMKFLLHLEEKLRPKARAGVLRTLSLFFPPAVPPIRCPSLTHSLSLSHSLSLPLSLTLSLYLCVCVCLSLPPSPHLPLSHCLSVPPLFCCRRRAAIAN